MPRPLTASTVAFILALAAVLSPSPAGAAQPVEWSPHPDAIWDVTNADPGVRHTGPVRALVWDLEEYNGRMYIAGKFLNVKAPNGTLVDQPYLAAFDLETGVWIDSFRPTVDGAVYAIDITDDGRLLAGGELTGGVAAFDVTTGIRNNTMAPGIINSWGPPAVFDVEIMGDDVFVGGNFSGAQGIPLSNLAKIDATTGALDLAWLPTADLDTGTPLLAGSRVYGISIDPARQRVYVVGKFGGINGDDTASYFATLDPTTGSLRNDLPQGIPPNILSHRERFSMWMQDVQWRDDKVYIGGQGHQTITMDAATLTPQSSFFTNRGVGDRWAGGDTQVIFLGRDTVWSGCHCWGSVGEYPLGSYIADPGGRQTYAEYVQWVIDFRDQNLFGQQSVKGGYGLDIETSTLVPLTFSVGGQGGAYAIFEDSNGRVWFGGHYTRDPLTGQVVEGLARFSPVNVLAGPTGLRSTRQTRERIVLTWDRFEAASGYEVYRDGVPVGTAPRVWFTDRDVTAGTSYTYTVRGVLGDGTMTPGSEPVTVTTVGDEPAGVPTGLRSTLQTRERIVVTWDRFPGASSYQVLADGVVVGTPTGRWFTHRNLAPATTITYTVQAVLADGTISGPSSSVAVATQT